MATSANAANIVNRGITRTVFRWIHIVFAIPILGYIYSPFEKLPEYAFKTRFVFVPVMVLSGLWMWKGHVVRRLISKTVPILVQSFSQENRSASSKI
jgi:thiosulfate reductase cytochrome b subunit